MVNDKRVTHEYDPTTGKYGPRTAPSSTSKGWDEWVAATAVRNHTINDPFLDWCSWFDKQRKAGVLSPAIVASLSWLSKDSIKDSRLDHLEYIFEKGTDFEELVIDEFVKKKIAFTKVASNRGDAREEARAKETYELMDQGTKVIYQGVLWNPNKKTYGIPDLLVRSDQIEDMMNTLYGGKRVFTGDSQRQYQAPASVQALSGVNVAAPDLEMRNGKQYHYRVIDIKFSTLHLKGDLHMMTADHKKIFPQLAVYDDCLQLWQGMRPPEAYALGRCWVSKFSRTVSGKKTKYKHRIDHAFHRLGAVNTAANASADADEGAAWIRDLRTKSVDRTGKLIPAYNPLVAKRRSEACPNMSNDLDQPWHGAKKHVSEQMKEITQIWNVGPVSRDMAIASGATGYDDSALSGLVGDPLNPLSLAHSVKRHGPLMAKMISINQKPKEKSNPAPGAALKGPLPKGEVEFYVDFETVVNTNDDFLNFPHKGGQDLIFMIGCFHIDGSGAKIFKEFTTKKLTLPEEDRIITEWLDHMDSVRNGRSHKVFHWTDAEKVWVENAEDRQAKTYPSIPWDDLCLAVIDLEFVVRGAWGYGLKPVAKALADRFNPPGDPKPAGKVIITIWPRTHIAGGLAAMMAGWRCAEDDPSDMRKSPYWNDLVAYNKVDCTVMFDILDHLRKNHP